MVGVDADAGYMEGRFMREYIKIPLRDDEYHALARLADDELRPVSMQAHRLVVEALRDRQLLIARPAAERVLAGSDAASGDMAVSP